MDKLKKFKDYNFVVVPTKGKEAREFIKKLNIKLAEQKQKK